MAEQTGKALNLGAVKAKPDANSQEVPDNQRQTPSPAAPGANSPEDQHVEAETQTQRGGRTDVSDTADELSAQSAANLGITSGEDGEEIWTSHPIMNYGLGRFTFENGTLRLRDSKDKADFAKLLESLPAYERNRVRKLSLDAVDRIVEDRKVATRQFDSSLGRQALEQLHADSPTIGKEDISHAARPQEDHNVPRQPDQPVDSEGASGLDLGPHTPPGE